MTSRKSTEVEALDEKERDSAVQRLAKSDLIPEIFASVDYFTAVAAGATRTGLLIGASGWGTILYQTSPLMDRLERLAPFRDALDDEPE